MQGNIEFRNVTFRYPSRDKIVLNGVSFSIRAGQKAAFVGPSGCGKSTIMQLLLRFYEPLEGEILLDGVSVVDYDLKALRSYFGVVSQEPVLFNATIKENIRYDRLDMDLEEIKRCAAQANALDFIMRSQFDVTQSKDAPPNSPEHLVPSAGGFDKSVGAKGSQISGGQKQRIAIARAIAKDPQILLLDEATSALDSENEKIVQESLDRIMQGKTSLAIAHRLSTIKDSNQIFVMEDGNIVEQGNYDDLMRLKGYFFRLEKGELK